MRTFIYCTRSCIYLVLFCIIEAGIKPGCIVLHYIVKAGMKPGSIILIKVGMKPGCFLLYYMLDYYVVQAGMAFLDIVICN